MALNIAGSLPDLTTVNGLRDKSILELFYSTGVRISELIKIKINDLDLDRKLIKVLGKGELFPAVPTRNDVAHPANRRVEISSN